MSSDPEAPKRLRTFRDIIDALPEHMTGQVIAGRLVVMPRPAPPHINAVSALSTLLNGPFQLQRGGPGGWWIQTEPELVLGIDADFEPVDPDLVGWRRERMPHLPETAAFDTVPDWICEVLSPSTEVHDRAEKMPFYARAGVEHACLVDPIERTLEAFRREGSVFRPTGTWRGDARVRVEPFDVIEIDLAHLWAR